MLYRTAQNGGTFAILFCRQVNAMPYPYSENGRLKAAQIIGNSSLGGVTESILNYYRHMDKSRWRFDFFIYESFPKEKNTALQADSNSGRTGSVFHGKSAPAENPISEKHEKTGGEPFPSLKERLNRIDPESRIYTIPRLDTHFYKAMPALKRLFCEGNYAVAHSHMTVLSAFALPPAKKAGIPVRICHAHSTFDKNSDHFLIKAALRPFAAKDANLLLACGKLAAQSLFRNRADDAILLPNAIDLEKFKPFPAARRAALREKLNLCGYTFLFVGRFAPQKNLSFLLDAFARLCEIIRSSERNSSNLIPQNKMPLLVLVGDGVMRPKLEKQAETLKIANQVLFVPPCDPLPWYQAADVFVLPSLYEGLPVVAAEAQAANLPCLFSDRIDRSADICRFAEFLPLDAELWAKRMLLPRERRSGGIRKLREGGYDIRLQAQKLQEIYDAALGWEL